VIAVAGVKFNITQGILYAYERNGYKVTMKVSYGPTSATFMASVKDNNGNFIYQIPRYEKYY
jgi:hypothetical protein